MIADHSTDMISKHDRSGRFLYVSPACRKLLGYEPEELVGIIAYELLHPEDLDAVPQPQDIVDGRSDIVLFFHIVSAVRTAAMSGLKPPEVS